LLTILFGLFLIVAAACSSDDAADVEEESEDASEESTADDDTIVMGLINWPENIAVNHVWQVILEEKGYDVELNPLEMGTIMAALETGDLDIGIEVWLPVQDKSYYEQYKDTVVFADEPWYDNGVVGLVVPEYMEDINSIEDLNDNKDLFEGEITGFEPGAGTMEVTEDLINEYDLDFELVPSSEPAMLTVIREAVEEEGAVVAPLWQPHGIFSEVDLKFLDDPQEIYGGVEEIYLATKTDFADEYPEVNDWLMNWSVDDETIGDLINFVVENDDHEAGAREWVEENQDLVEEWTK